MRSTVVDEVKTYTAVAGIRWAFPDGRSGAALPGEPVPAYVVETSPWLLKRGRVRLDVQAAGGK